MSSPVRFEMDRRAFGVVNFPQPRGKAHMAPLTQALQASLGVRIRARKAWWFGRKRHSFVFMGETVDLKVLENGDVVLDLGMIDDEARETLLEYLRTSHDFLGR